MKKLYKIIFLGIIFFLILEGYYFLNQKFGLSIPCLFHKITGFYCPGCGITRMLFSLIELNFYQAFRYNPLTFILLLLFLIYKIIYLIGLIIYHHKLKINSLIYYLLIIITIGFGIIRNIPQFDYLKPTVVISK